MRKLSVLIAIVLLALAGCASVRPVKTPYADSYSIDSLPTMVSKRAHTNKTLLISKPRSNPGYETRNMVYIVKSHELKAFAKHQWVAPPADMLQPLIAEALRKTEHYLAVVGAPYAGLSDLRLDLQLFQLQQDFRTHPSRVHIQLEANLIDNINNKILATSEFKITIPTVADNPYAGVEAINLANAKLMGELVEFVVSKS